METDGQRLYSFLTRKEVGEKMMKEISQISEVFSLSKSDATIILIHLQWSSFKASDRLVDDKEKFLADFGLVKVSNSRQENESYSFFADNLVSTPFCSHKFCKTCWREHLNEVLVEKEDRVVTVLCPNEDCVAPVGPETIEKLTEPDVKEMYESYVLRSFMQSNKETIKWCPAIGCEYVIECHEDQLEDDEPCLDFCVVCLCGHTFCWSCQLESHRPVTCKDASVWCDSTLNKLKSSVWEVKNTKRCPKCYSPVQRSGDPDLRLITCICSCIFCWRCFRSKEAHNGKWNCAQKPSPTSTSQEKDCFYMRMWEESDEEFEKAKLDLKAIEEKRVPVNFTDGDVNVVKEASLLMVQCRLVLKWSCVYEYNYKGTREEYVKDLRGEATETLLKHKKALEDLMNQALSPGQFGFFKHKLSTSTLTTGNHFHEFIKSLEGGIPKVEVGSL